MRTGGVFVLESGGWDWGGGRGGGGGPTHSNRTQRKDPESGSEAFSRRAGGTEREKQREREEVK